MHDPICLSPGSRPPPQPQAQDPTGEPPLDGLEVALEAPGVRLPGAPGWPGVVPEAGQEGPRSHGRSVTGCSRLPGSEFLGLKTQAGWPAPGTRWPSVTPPALLSRHAGGRVLSEELCPPHPGDRGRMRPPCVPCSFPQTGCDGFLPCAKCPGVPGPGGASRTPTLSTQAHFWEPAGLPTPSTDVRGQRVRATRGLPGADPQMCPLQGPVSPSG